MNRKSVFAQGISAAAVLLMIAGCSVPTVTVDCTMPPQAITNIKGVDTMEVVVSSTLTGNRIAAGDDFIAKGAVCERVAAKFGGEGYYRTTDFVWGSPKGASEMFLLLRARKSRHGYARLTTNPVQPRARLELKLTAEVMTGDGNKVVDTPLKAVYYQTRYRNQTIHWGKNNKETVRVPYSVPVRTTKSVARSNVRQYWISAKGSLEAKLIDKSGKVVYQKNFDGLQFNAVCDDTQMGALPTNAQVFSALTKDAVTGILKDLSPYKVSKKIKINKDGDKRGFYLLESLAFSEAAAAYEAIDEKDRTFADWENYGIVCEVLGDLSGARKCFETAAQVKKAKKGMFDYDKNIAEEGIARVDEALANQKKLDKIK